MDGQSIIYSKNNEHYIRIPLLQKRTLLRIKKVMGNGSGFINKMTGDGNNNAFKK